MIKLRIVKKIEFSGSTDIKTYSIIIAMIGPATIYIFVFELV